MREARERRKERGLTQRHLAALANVGRSTLSRFENQNGDVTLSSVLRILGVLDILDRKQEGTLRVKASETQRDRFDVTFTSNFGGNPREAKTIVSREALEKFLAGLRVPEEMQKRSIAEVEARGTASIPGVLMTQTEIEANWPRLERFQG